MDSLDAWGLGFEGWQSLTAMHGGRVADNGHAFPRQDAAHLLLAVVGVPGHNASMESHEVLREAFKATSAKQIAADMNLSLSLVYKWTEAPAKDAVPTNPLDRIDQILRFTKDVRVLQWLCERSGGFFIHNPKARHPHPAFLIPATNQVVQEFADLLAVVAAAAADNTINPAEAAKIRARWEQLKGATETFVRSCEGGNFAGLRPGEGDHA